MNMKAIDVATDRILQDETLSAFVSLEEKPDDLVEITLSLPDGYEAGTSIATSLNAVALRVISRLGIVTDADVDVSMPSIRMQPLQEKEGKNVLVLESKFFIKPSATEKVE
jgi:hypothetical protein